MPDTSDPLRVLPRETLPPHELRERVRNTLRARGHLRRSHRRVYQVAAALAAAVLLFIAGRVTTNPRAPSGDASPEFALLLYQDSGFDYSGIASYYGEYSRWAQGLNERGLLVKDRALDSASTLLRGSGGSMRSEPREVTTDAGRMTGLFIIRAADLRAALAIAATCPHLKHGGTIALRPISRGP